MDLLDIITSRSNGIVVDTAKLKDKKYRDEAKSFLFEGIKLYSEAIASGVNITHIFLTEKCAKKHPELLKRKEALLISEGVCAKLSENSAPEGIICRARYMEELHRPYVSANEIDVKDTCLLLSTIQDPGNLGTIARTSAALGKKTLILSSDCADIYSQKTLRASMGAMFRMSVYRTHDLKKTIENIKKTGTAVYATALTDKALSLKDVSDCKACCFVLGNEGHGLSQSIIESCSGTVIIPMEKDAESLNVSSAATVILWEAYR